MANASKSPKPFEGLRCPHCGELDCLDVRVETLALECRECSEAITWPQIDAMIARWQGLFGWLDSAANFAAPE